MSNVAFADFSVRNAIRSNRMENQKNGFILLYRSVLKQPWSKDVFLRTLWENLLMQAARQPYTANFRGTQWPLQTGQLVTTTVDLGLNLCDREGKPTSRHAVDRMLDIFEREGMISRAGEKRKGTVITITNYAEYAQKADDLPALKPAHIAELKPAHGEASNGAASEGDAAHSGEHKPALKPAHHEQQYKTLLNTNVFNDRRRISKSHAGAAIQTPKGDKWGTAEDLQCAEWILSLVETIKPSTAKTDLAPWANDVRLMRELDGRSHREICELFRWASRDAFWCSNILSPKKLRAKWDTLSMQRSAGNRKTTSSAASLDNTDWIDGVFK